MDRFEVFLVISTVVKIADRDLENNTNLNPINNQAWPGSMERSDGRDNDRD